MNRRKSGSRKKNILPSQTSERAAGPVSDCRLVVDAEGRILDVGGGCTEFLGFARRELLGMTAAEVFPTPDFEDALIEEAVSFRTAGRGKYGAGNILDVRVRPFRLEGALYRFIDVSDSMEVDESKHRLRFLDTLIDCLPHITSRGEFLDVIVNTVGKLTGCRCVGIRILDDEGNIPYESHTGFSREFLESESPLSLNRDDCVCVRVIKRKLDPCDLPLSTAFGSFVCNDTAEFERSLSKAQAEKYRGVCIRSGFLSVAVVPVRSGERIIGLVHIADEAAGKIPLDLLTFVESIAEHIGRVVLESNTEEALLNEHNFQATINSLLSLSFENLSLQDLLQSSLDLILSVPWLKSRSRGCLFLVEDEPNLLVMKAEVGLCDSVKASCREVPFGAGLCGRAAATGELKISNCSNHENCSRDRDDYFHYCVPVATPDKMLGVLCIHIDEERRRSGREERHLEAIAKTLAGIIIRKRTEESLRRSEARYRAIVQSQTELVSRFSPDGILTFVNDAYCRYFGESREQLIGNKLWHHVPESDRKKLKKYLATLTPDNPVGMIEHRVYVADGELRWQQWTDRAVFDENGRLLEIQATGRDISERKHAEIALRESQDQLRFLSSQLIIAQENERKRIAWDLHDSIGQYLTAIKFTLENAAGRGDGEIPSPSAELLRDAVRIVQTTVDEVRRIMTDLRPSMLDDLGIVATIGWFCREFRQIYSCIRVETRIEVAEGEIPERLKIAIFRVLQEAMNNVAKHSKAEAAEIYLGKKGESIELAVSDNGRGFHLTGAHIRRRSPGKGGLGLTSMKERVELSGGAFTVLTTRNVGTMVKASWPRS